MQKFKRAILYVFGGGTLVCVGYSVLHLLAGQGDVSQQGALVAFGIGCGLGLLYGAWREFA